MTAKGYAARAVPSFQDVEDLGRGCGAVGQRGLLGKVAVSVDEHGARHETSGRCPHMGCALTAFRDGCFTCPCHGSVFDARGVCIGAPATSDLAPLCGGPQAAEE